MSKGMIVVQDMGWSILHSGPIIIHTLAAPHEYALISADLGCHCIDVKCLIRMFQRGEKLPEVALQFIVRDGSMRMQAPTIISSFWTPSPRHLGSSARCVVCPFLRRPCLDIECWRKVGREVIRETKASTSQDNNRSRHVRGRPLEMAVMMIMMTRRRIIMIFFSSASWSSPCDLRGGEDAFSDWQPFQVQI